MNIFLFLVKKRFAQINWAFKDDSSLGIRNKELKINWTKYYLRWV
jgi:hypothetical protein